MPHFIYRKEVQRLMAAGAQVVEALPAEDYEDEHLPGAINLPLKTLTRETASRLDRNRAVITYCDDHQ